MFLMIINDFSLQENDSFGFWFELLVFRRQWKYLDAIILCKAEYINFTHVLRAAIPARQRCSI